MAAIMHFSSLEGVRRRGDKAARPLSQSSAGTPLVLRVKRLLSEVNEISAISEPEMHSCKHVTCPEVAFLTSLCP